MTRRLRGVLFWVLGILFFGVLLFYDIEDPSFNRLTDASPAHPLGLFGSYGSDLLRQFWGLFSFGVPLALCCWGSAFFIGKRFGGLGWRFVALLLGMSFGAAAAVFWDALWDDPSRDFWTSPRHGGLLGWRFYEASLALFHSFIELDDAALAFLSALVASLFALGFFYYGLALGVVAQSKWLQRRFKKKAKLAPKPAQISPPHSFPAPQAPSLPPVMAHGPAAPGPIYDHTHQPPEPAPPPPPPEPVPAPPPPPSAPPSSSAPQQAC